MANLTVTSPATLHCMVLKDLDMVVPSLTHTTSHHEFAIMFHKSKYSYVNLEHKEFQHQVLTAVQKWRNIFLKAG